MLLEIVTKAWIICLVLFKAILTIIQFVKKIVIFCYSKYTEHTRDYSSLHSTHLNRNNTFNQGNFYQSYGNSRIFPSENVFEPDVIDSSDWNDFNNDYFYHYTSLQCARQILQSRRIIASVPKVKRFGKNVYFTKCKPDLNDDQLVKNNYIYNSRIYLNNIQCAFAIRRYDLVLNKVSDKFNRDIWRHADDIDLNQTEFKVIIRQPHYRYHINI